MLPEEVHERPNEKKEVVRSMRERCPFDIQTSRASDRRESSASLIGIYSCWATNDKEHEYN